MLVRIDRLPMIYTLFIITNYLLQLFYLTTACLIAEFYGQKKNMSARGL